MTQFAKFAAGPVAALVLSMQTPALAASDPGPIHVLCTDTAQAPLCDGLRDALAARFDGRPVRIVRETGGTAGLTLRFVALRQNAHALAGHLAWTLRGGATGAGPELELSSIDAPLGPEMLRDYGRQLVRFTDIPL